MIFRVLPLITTPSPVFCSYLAKLLEHKTIIVVERSVQVEQLRLQHSSLYIHHDAMLKWIPLQFPYQQAPYIVSLHQAPMVRNLRQGDPEAPCHHETQLWDLPSWSRQFWAQSASGEAISHLGASLWYMHGRDFKSKVWCGTVVAQLLSSECLFLNM